MEGQLTSYFAALAQLARSVEVSADAGSGIAADEGVRRVQTAARAAHDRGDKIMFVGNGGSAAIASHCAIDYSKNGGLRATAFNDGAALTCLGNDLGYENVFSTQIELHARAGDLLIAISSSGRSPNILNAVKAARARGCMVVTLSGFTPENPLRTMGDVNFYVASSQYGFVEILHLTLCHAILDLAMGWRDESSAASRTESARMESV